MRINKILNNNVVIAIIDGEEIVVMGKGVGFQKKVGDIISPENIEKVFKLQGEKENRSFNQLMGETPAEYLTITKDIVTLAEEKLKITLNEVIYIILTDHLFFAVTRKRENIRIDNPILWEIKSLYKKEFKVGLVGIEIVKKYTGVSLSEDEAGFIALHIINAALNEDMSNTMNITIMTNKILSIVKREFNIQFDENSLDYMRFLTHLKFFAQRIFKRTQIKDEDAEFYEMVVNKYKEEKQCINKIENYIKKQFNYRLSKQEVIYLIMHIRKFRL
ncbi:BglG family transcription antiterminator LicT [uncultured Clostridium sp.]|uniref:BglG family transcription antiterminator LicT n=1 Tax=uncultured Clostridium sp. TaxID=59620 RepID=UPI002629FB40|nr:PRD domain-containing protein [uncultured Clostridium sp.]